jgi:hypothetical protein
LANEESPTSQPSDLLDWMSNLLGQRAELFEEIPPKPAPAVGRQGGRWQRIQRVSRTLRRLAHKLHVRSYRPESLTSFPTFHEVPAHFASEVPVRRLGHEEVFVARHGVLEQPVRQDYVGLSSRCARITSVPET